MKKYGITIIVVFIILIVIRATSLIDRIAIICNGMEAYDISDYNISYTDIKEKKIQANMKEYIGEQYIIDEKGDTKLYIKDIIYQGNIYVMEVVSEVNNVSFSGCKMYEFKNSLDKELSSDNGRYLMQYRGEDGVEDNKKVYYFDIAPLDNQTMEQVANTTLELVFDNIVLASYERK